MKVKKTNYWVKLEVLLQYNTLPRKCYQRRLTNVLKYVETLNYDTSLILLMC